MPRNWIKQILVGSVFGLLAGGAGTGLVAGFKHGYFAAQPSPQKPAIDLEAVSRDMGDKAGKMTADIVVQVQDAVKPKTGTNPVPGNPPILSKTEEVVLRGAARAADSAKLLLNGRDLPLYGLIAVNRPEAVKAAQSYLDAKGAVECRPHEDAWRCLAGGHDLSVVFALSGFAQAASNAGTTIAEAETKARTAKRGIWSTF